MAAFKSHLRSEIDRIRSSHSNTGQAFDWWVARHCTPGDDVPPEFTLVDGSSDHGIDAVWINDQNKEFIIFQGKWSSGGQTTYGRDPLVLLKEAVSLLKNEQRCRALASQQNNYSLEDASEKYQIYVAAEGYKPHIILGHTGRLSTEAREELDNLQNDENFITSEWDIKRLHELFEIFISQPPHSTELNVGVNEYFVSEDKNYAFAMIDGYSLKEVIKKQPGLLNDNVRGFLGYKKSTTANTDMKNTVKDSPEKFWKLNNGLTIVCEDFEFGRKRRGSNLRTLRLEKGQIVNGGQTTVVLSREADRNVKKVRVAAKIIASLDDIEDIAIATNTQAPVKMRDIRSKDPRHSSLREVFLEDAERLYYDYRAGDWAGVRTRDYMRVNNRDVAKSVLCCMGLPADAKNKGRVLFEDRYEDIMSKNPYRMLIMYKIFSFVNTIKSEFKKKDPNMFKVSMSDEEKETLEKEKQYILHAVEHFTYGIYSLLKKAIPDFDDEGKIQDIYHELCRNHEAFISRMTWLFRIVDGAMPESTRELMEQKETWRRVFISRELAERMMMSIDAELSRMYTFTGKTFSTQFEERDTGQRMNIF